MTRSPPQSISGILRQLGPGLIIAGSIVGSGELIATTKTGSEAGFWLLWLIIVGCVVKMFAQVEFGRYTISSGKTAIEGLNEVPGPRWRVNWILWYWLAMFVVSMAQLGGIVGGVGQALAIVQPITSRGAASNAYQDAVTRRDVATALIRRAEDRLAGDPSQSAKWTRSLDRLRTEKSLADAEIGRQAEQPLSYDDVYWAAFVTLLTIGLLVLGRYGLIQAVSTFLVAAFTLITIGNLVHLQTLAEWRISFAELTEGLSFRLPPANSGSLGSPLTTALATLGIIGVGATELIQYPYWCLEKGYARWIGPSDDSEAWIQRASGWIRVLRWDALCSAMVYTFATVAFYLLGAAVLGRTGLVPQGTQMVRTLSEMYVPVFGLFAQAIFLVGAVAVLYSTFFVSNAGHARVCADALRVFGFPVVSREAKDRWVRIFSVFFPLTCLLVYASFRSPVKLILASGVMQAIMLPMLGGAALYFRYRRSDRRLAPGKLWDACLWISGLALLISGGWLALTKIFPGLESLL